jgi:nitroreductase
MLNDLSSPLAFLATRRSCKPRDLIEPGPDEAQLRSMLGIAARSPDHGKLAPWRFVVVPGERRAAFGDMLEAASISSRPASGRSAR